MRKPHSTNVPVWELFYFVHDLEYTLLIRVLLTYCIYLYCLNQTFIASVDFVLVVTYMQQDNNDNLVVWKYVVQVGNL